MECLANGAAVAQRLGDIAFSLVAPVLPRDAPFATQQIELRCRKRFC